MVSGLGVGSKAPDKGLSELPVRELQTLVWAGGGKQGA